MRRRKGFVKLVTYGIALVFGIYIAYFISQFKSVSSTDPVIFGGLWVGVILLLYFYDTRQIGGPDEVEYEVEA